MILQYKITPILLDTNTLVEALNKQLESTPEHISEGIKRVYADVVKTVVMTANDEQRVSLVVKDKNVKIKKVNEFIPTNDFRLTKLYLRTVKIFFAMVGTRQPLI